MTVYLDNSATTWPKPPEVVKAISEYLTDYGASPGRSGHRFSLMAARQVFETRELLAGFFHIPDSENIIFSANATHALNIAIKGIVKQNDHVIISHLEHNSVVRPLKHLENEGMIDLTIIDCDERGFPDTEKFKKSLKANTKLVITLHGSNAAGTIVPVRQIGEICRNKGVIYLVDAAQTAGLVPIDMQKDNIDVLAFTGHKKMYGPPGIGGLCINTNIPIETLIHGGTGSKSEMDIHPGFYPDKLEAGTINTVGIVGLKAGVNYILKKGIDNIREEQDQLTNYFINRLQEIEEVILYGSYAEETKLPLVSLNIKNIVPSDLARRLDKEFGIMVRSGIHCAPLAHKAMGTLPQGVTRFSFGAFNTEDEVKYTIECLKKISVKSK